MRFPKEKTCDYFVKHLFRPFAHTLVVAPNVREQGGTELVLEQSRIQQN